MPVSIEGWYFQLASPQGDFRTLGKELLSSCIRTATHQLCSEAVKDLPLNIRAARIDPVTSRTYLSTQTTFLYRQDISG